MIFKGGVKMARRNLGLSLLMALTYLEVEKLVKERKQKKLDKAIQTADIIIIKIET
jgi:hypothetical protein